MSQSRAKLGLARESSVKRRPSSTYVLLTVKGPTATCSLSCVVRHPRVARRPLPPSLGVLAATRVATGDPVEGWLDLHGGEHRGHGTPPPTPRARLRFWDVEFDPGWDAGVRLPGSPVYFPERSNCRVRLYQNSPLSGEFDPWVRLVGGLWYRLARLREDLHVAIRDARQFLYVAGCSVNTAITLVRDAAWMIPEADGVTLGELLRRKADEGVRL
uniref:Uncharacterized protein n=1 Tax=Oryza brachyantha TaxID=4533 RepID=J3NDD3_ORYBR